MAARAGRRYRVRYYLETMNGFKDIHHDFPFLWVAKVVRWLASKQSNILNPVISINE